MDSPKSVIVSLLLTIERLSKALESLEQRVTLIERFQFESAATWRKKERTCSELFLKMVEKINAIEKRLDIPKEDAQIQTDQVKKKDKLNQTENKKTKTVGSLVGATVGEQCTQTEAGTNSGDKNGDQNKLAEETANKDRKPVEQVCKAQSADRPKTATKRRPRSSSIRKVRLIPIAVGYGPNNDTYGDSVFGEEYTKAPVYLRIVISWVLIELEMPKLEEDITKYVNGISWSDLNVDRLVYLTLQGFYLERETPDEQHPFQMKYRGKLIQLALTSDPSVAQLIANALAALHQHAWRPMIPMQREDQRVLADRTVNTMVVMVLGAACLWVNHPKKVRKWTKGMPKSDYDKVSKYLTTVAENQFSRVAWFICCLRNCGILTRHHLLNTLNLISLTEPITYAERGPHKFHFLRRYLSLLAKNTVAGQVYGEWNPDVENPLYCEENMADPKAAKLDRLIDRYLNSRP